MITDEDEPLSGLNGRLRPRKSNIPSPQLGKSFYKADVKLAHETKSKRTSVASKVFPNKPDDLTHKADTPAPQILCPYCDSNFFGKQAASKHIRNTHLLTPKQDHPINCLFCNHIEDDGNKIIRHMVDNHPNQYFACYDCHTRFPSTTELAEHKLNACERSKLSYRTKLRQITPKNNIKDKNINEKNEYGSVDKNYTAGNGFNGIVISCELKPSHLNDPTDIEDNITTNLILPSSKSISSGNVIDKNAVIVLDDLQWNKRISSNFSFHNADADQILSRLGVVHRSPRTSESNRREWFKIIDESTQKFEKCFDTSFYSKVASNVQENLMKFLDGSFNFNPDAENTIKTRKSKNSVAINTVEGFPILLSSDQINRNIFDAYMPRAIAPKHKWKWDNLENEKTIMTPDQIKRDSHTNNCIVSLVSSLDIWTQLSMRIKYEENFNKSPREKKNEKQSIIEKELKEILESRELPSSSQIVTYIDAPTKVRNTSEFPSSLDLVPATRNYNLKPAVLSGEWVRPRCYVCCACGAQTRDSRALTSHISNHHPNAQIQHYEIVGEVLLKSDILKHLYVPPSQINNRTRPLRGFRECTKCKKSISLDDLHQHMLDCAGDTPAIRRKCRYRPFGMRKKRPRLPDNTIRKKMRKDIRSRHNRKKIRSRQKIRTEVGDAETIRKMLADLPAKRHRVVVNQLNPIMRPRRKLNKQRSKLVRKKRMADEVKKKAPISNFSHASGLSGDESKKGSSNHVNRKPIKRTVKRVASKLVRHKDSLTKKATMTRSRRKGVPKKVPSSDSQISDLGSQPTDAEGDGQNQQRSTENNPDRNNVNEGSYNGQERSNGNNEPDNRDNPSQNGGENNNSDNSDNSDNPSAPTENTPLKHSIARLTAKSDTKDKALEFHELSFLQPQCNNPYRYICPEERLFFEDEAVVIKLDKPPLHFDHQVFFDPERNKFNKRKGLNDCIAMLKNKLVEPRLSPPPGHIPVQYRTDVPLDPQPPISDRRYSTTDMNIENIQRLMHYQDLDKNLSDTRGSCSTRSRVTRRSYSARGQPRKETYSDNDINRYMQWKLYCDSQMYAAQRNFHQYTRRDSSLLTSVPPEDLMMHQAMAGSLDLLTSNPLINFHNYNYITPIAPQKSPRKSRCDRSKSGSMATKDTCIASDMNSMNMANLPTYPRPRRNSNRKTVLNAAGVFPGRTSVAQSAPEAFPERTTVMQNAAEAFPGRKSVTQSATEIFPGRTNVTQSAAKVFPGRTSVTQSAAEVFPERTNVTQSAAEVFPERTNVTQIAAEVFPERTNVTQSTAEVFPERTNVTQSAAELFPGRTNVTQSAAEVFPERTDVTQSAAELFPGRTSVTQSAAEAFRRRTSVTQNAAELFPRRKSVTQSASEVYPGRTSVTQNIHAVEGNARRDNLTNAKIITNVYAQRALSEDRANRVMETSVLPNNLREEQAYQRALLYQNVPLMQYPKENDLGSVHYRLHSVEAINAVPLDLSKKSSNTVEQQRVVRYVTEKQSRSTNCGGYKTLDLSKRTSNQIAQQKIESQVNRNDISNIHINHDYPLNNSTSLTTLPPEMVLNSIENSLTNMSLGHTGAVYHKKNYYPVELSNKGTDKTNLYEKRKYQNLGKMVTNQDRSHPVIRTDYMNTVNRLREDYLAVQGPTDLSSRRHKNSPNISATSDKRVVNLNIPKINLEPNNDNMLSDLSANSKETEDRIYLDSKGIREYYQTVVLNNKTSSTHNNSKPQLSLNCINAEKMFDAHYSRTVSPQTNNARFGTIINYPESTVHRSITRDNSQNITSKVSTTTALASDDSQNISTSKLKAPTAIKCDITTAVSTKSLCNSDLRNEITYTHIDVPLSSSFNLAPNSQDCNSIEMSTTRESFSNIYKHTQPGFVSPNVSPYRQIECSKLVNSNNTNSLSVAHKLPTVTTGSVVMSESSVSLSLHKLKNNDLRRLRVEETEETTVTQKHIPKIHIKQDSEKSGSETAQSDSITTASDHDTETARKIAMLPKELVDIIGNIPVDHRNQLLSVLPQYVSTSTSHNSLSNMNKSRDNCVHLNSNYTSPTHINNDSESDRKSDTKLHEGNILVSNVSVAQNSQFIDSSPTAITSSILLTPPTPQFSDSHSKSQEINETTFLKYRTKFPHSNDEQTPLRTVDSDKLITGSNLPLIKRLKLDENYTKDRVINLSSDEFRSENPDPSIQAIPLPSAPLGTNVPKIYSDKTASLRAVRIKTPSERHRSIVPVSTKTKVTTNVLVNVTDDELDNRITNITNPLVIQGISSTQNQTMSQNSPISSILDQSYKQDNLIGDIKERLDKETIIKSELEKNNGLQNKQNVTSLLIKDINDIKNVDSFKQKDHFSENSFEIINASSSKKNETYSDMRLDTGNSIKNVTSEKPVEKQIMLKDKVLIENEDSEDDVSLANIVKQRNRDIKLDTKNNNGSCSKKKRKINKLKVSKQITEENSSQDRSGVILSDYDVSYADTDLTKQLSESSAKIKDTEPTEDLSNEKGISSKKNIRKERKVNHSNMEHDNLYHSVAENEINKENNLSPEVVKNNDEDVVNSKSSETDTNRSTVPNKMVTTMDREISSKNEKVEALELNTPSTADSLKTQESNCDSETIKNITNKEPETSKLMSCKDKVNPINQDNNSNNELKKTNANNQTEEKPDDTKNNTQNNDILFKNKPDSSDISTEKHEDDQEDEAGMTPLRRSRRGKSLFIDNSSTVKNNSFQTENSLEHRTPLTKKQLIFSKLLLDEENHNKLTNNRFSETQRNEITPVNQFKDSYEFTSESEIEKEPEFEDKIQCNKRRKSQQFKKKGKKQKPLINLQTTSECSEVKTTTKSEIPSNRESPKADNIVSVPNVSSQATENYLSKKDPKTNNETVNEINTASDLPIENFNKEITVSTEKRKSSSPSRCGLLLSLKPKKTKLNDEDNEKIPVIHNQDVKVIEKEVKHVENNGGVRAIVVSRNTPCYNKPVPRRARSKSVVVKSSGAELYDPYDINLEDMVEKTEPFVRKEMTTKIGLYSFKSSIANKTRKLSKTAPSAIIDISPSECSDVTLSSIGNINQVNKPMNVTKDFSIDSDESSKSDVPLKKYVEEKERKRSEESNNIKDESKGNTNSVEKSEKSGGKSKPRKKNKLVQAINNKDVKARTKEDTEEELRSQQFMESFGFFSERKPRKSNLLATKKISETFHIIGNDSDDNSFGSKEFLPKKGDKYSSNKKPARRGRKKKSEPPPGPSYCDICKKAFRRSDNYVRHQVSLIHITKFSEVELNLKTVQIEEEPNYLIAYKQQLDRLKVLQNKIAKRKKNCLSTDDIILPTLEEILADVKRTIREQQLSRMGLSRDQELFIDCCEMLKESHKNDQAPLNKRTRNCNSFNCAVTCQEELALLERSISDDRCDIKCDGEVDSITAKNILESEEVRNLENDLIFNLKEANKLKGTMINVHINPPEEYTIEEKKINYDEESHKIKSKPQIEIKDKMYPGEEIIDMFEDKFDKIKRKCRSQAAAAKQIQTHVDVKLVSHKNKKSEKKSEKKKGKKSSKKCQGTVPTKGALKGFDGIKVSIPTSDINLSAIVSPVGNSSKKKKKCSRKKRDKKYSNESAKSNNNDQCSKGSIQNKADVYEFMDTEDTELFEFRPSTLMERFKSISNKEAVPSTSKTMDQIDLADVSSESASDGDDFVYMSDDYVCSDDETENSMVSCELGNGLKKSASPLKRKDVMEKNAVMGKIFKHNAVRSERRSPKRRESPKPKANFDQLFDSLLKDEHKPLSPVKHHPHILLEGEQPSTSRLYSSLSPKLDADQNSKYDDFTSKLYDKEFPVSKDISDTITKSDITNYPSTSSNKRKSITPPKKLDINLIHSIMEYEVLAPMRNEHFKKYLTNNDRPSTYHSDAYSKKYDTAHSEEADDSSTDEDTLHREHYSKHKSVERTHKKKPYINKKKEDDPENNETNNHLEEVFGSAGVARQRARRKCTVGKQNVLAETWSSESEPDVRPPRPNSAESVIGGARKKRGRKKDMTCNRKVNRSVKKLETEMVGRPRSPCYWSEGEEEQEHPQQHGWIVGDSHKKLVTMLAHAKGRKRHDDKRQILE